jgi:hypothetical protein
MKMVVGLFLRDQIFATGSFLKTAIREKPPIRRLRAFQFQSKKMSAPYCNTQQHHKGNGKMTG